MYVEQRNFYFVSGDYRTIVVSRTFCASNKSARECDVKGSEKQSVVLQ